MIFLARDFPAPAPAYHLAIEWEETGCLMCGRRHWSQFLEAPDLMADGSGLWFAIVQCQGCGLCFTNPRPSPKSIASFYPPAYPPHRKATRPPGSPSRLRWPARWRLPGRERPLLSWEGPPGRLLDFGCGAGTFMARMSRQGWQVTGIDSSPAAVQRIEADLHLPVLAGSLPHPDLAPGSFEVITMRHSLEHVHDPLEVLRQAYRLLTPGGKLLVAVPNIESLPFRWFRQAWVGLDLPRHLTHFAPWTLQQMLLQAGFEVGPIRMVRHRNWMRSSAERSCRAGRGGYWHRLLKRKSTAGLATWYSYVTAQADCLLVTAGRGPDIH